MQETTFFFNLEEIMAISYAKQHVGGCCRFSKVRPYVHYFSDKTYLQYVYVILPYINCTLTSLYDENKLCISCLPYNQSPQKSALYLSSILANADDKTTSRELAQVL